MLTPIETIEDLHHYLYVAIQLEHATIPPYLTALYTIHPGTNIDAYNVIRVVVVEEMLHLTLSANILNAVGGKPNLTKEGFVPTYPTVLPNGETDFEVSLQKFSPEAIDTFLKIERPPEPEEEGVKKKMLKFIPRATNRVSLLPTYYAPKADGAEGEEEELHFYTIGEFYHAIELGIEKLVEELGEEAVFCGDPSHQVTPEYYYSGGGDIVSVYDLESAKQAIRLISEQGEGYQGGIFDHEGELSHFYRFEQLILGSYYHQGDTAGEPTGEPVNIDWDAVYPIQTNASTDDYPADSELSTAALDFNVFYLQYLEKIQTALNGQPALLIPAIGDMFKIKEMAYQLIRNPIPGKPGVNAAPTFEIDAVLSTATTPA